MFTLTIETDNDAFHKWPAHEVVADMLEAVARQLRDGKEKANVRGPTGITVGTFTLTED